MTPEDKQLLLKDLCARLPYGVKGRYCLYDSEGNLTDWGNEPEIVENIDFKESKIWTEDTVQGYYLDEFKPYLRPMSSMTDKEKEELKEEHKKDERIYAEVIERIANGDEYARGTAVPHFAADWCNKNHFDYRGLIPMGLALEAPKDMYKTE